MRRALRMMSQKIYSPGQLVYRKALEDPSKPIIIVTGPAGSGKTALACEWAQDNMIRKRFNKLILTKPAVGVDESHGFLPGTLDKKMKPWVQPLMDELDGLPGKIAQRVEMAPLSFMRGRTFNESIVIADEMQNSTSSQMKMILTRLGENSKMIVTGDVDQHDRHDTSGLEELLRISVHMDLQYIQHVMLDTHDIQRHPAVAEVLGLYDRTDNN